MVRLEGGLCDGQGAFQGGAGRRQLTQLPQGDSQVGERDGDLKLNQTAACPEALGPLWQVPGTGSECSEPRRRWRVGQGR